MASTGIRRRKGTNIIERDTEETTTVHRSPVGWSKAVCTSLLCTVLLLPIVVWFIPAPIDAIAYSLPTPPAWTGALSPNTLLQKAVRLYENKMLGPESMVADKDYLYTGTADGKILEIYKGEIRVLTKLGREPCGRFEDEPTCGRPLGMRLDKDGYLIVIDTYLGLYKVNVATGDFTVLWPASEPINGKPPRFLNDLDIGPDGTIYMTDSSTKWQRRHNRYCILEGETTGRLLAYHQSTNTTVELLSGIAFANGVQISRDKTFLLIVSTTKCAVYKYYISGEKRGVLETFNDNLPGLPDNIRRSSLGGYWVGLAVVRKPTFSMPDFSSQRPWLRTFITKILSQDTIINLAPKYGMLIHLNEQGEITKSLHDPSGVKVPAISEVEERDGVLYLGSYGLPYLSKLYLSDIK